MTDANAEISNGSCYWDSSGDEAPSRFIPCGNSALGHVSCCESQDVCLSSNACFNGQYTVTYLAGCTDKEYNHENCPDKGDFSDQVLVGLVYCNGTSNEWTGCRDSEPRETVASPDPCWCPQTSRTALFEDAPTLTNIIRLPMAKGETVTWLARPTTPSLFTSPKETSISESSVFDSTSKPTLSAGEPSVTAFTNTTSEPALPSTISTSEPSSLSIGAKVGIGVGAGVGGFALLVLLVIMIRWCLTTHEKDRTDTEEKGQVTSASYLHAPQESSHKNTETQSPAWSGYKSELPGHECKLTPSPTFADFGSNKSEVEGSPGIGGTARPVSGGGYEMPGKPGTVYEMSA